MIPIANLDLSAQVESEIKNAINSVIKSKKFVLGPRVESFEKKFAAFVGTKHAIGVGNGTDALRLAIRSLGIKKGDKILTSAFTSPFTALAITEEGAIPTFCDVDEKTWTIDCSDAEKKIDQHTKAIMPVHIFGNPCDMDKILSLSQKYNLFVIEDACQAHGAIYRNKKIGSFGDAAAFSFYPTKNLGALGDGGIITTNSKKTAKFAKILRHGGQTKRFWHKYQGMNSRLDEIQASILQIRLKHLVKNNLKRKLLASRYKKYLKDLPLSFQKTQEFCLPNFHLFVIKTKHRNKLLNFLISNKINSDIYYPYPLHLQPIFKKYAKDKLKECEKLSKELIALPLSPNLRIQDQDRVIHLIKLFYNYKSQ